MNTCRHHTLDVGWVSGSAEDMRALCRSALAARRGPTLAPQARTRAARPMTRHVATGAEGGGSTPTSGPAAVQQMPVQELAELLANPALLEEVKWVLCFHACMHALHRCHMDHLCMHSCTPQVQCVDVREEGEWRTARLPHFKLLPLSQSGTW